MFAVVETSGRQYRVEPGQTITVDRMSADAGSTVTLDRVLMLDGRVGTPVVAGANVTARVVSHGKGDKVITFKYRRRSRMRRRVGFRASLTVLEIVSVNA